MYPIFLGALVPILWSIGSQRLVTAITIWLCYLCAFWEEGQAIHLVLSKIPEWMGYALLLGHISLITSFWMLLWTPKNRPLSLYLSKLAILNAGLLLPPLGWVAWLHPWSYAGWVYPHWGWFGIFLINLFLLAIYHYHHRLIISLILLSCLDQYFIKSPQPLPHWHAISTQLPPCPGDFPTIYQRQKYLMERIKQLKDNDADIMVLPENIAGYWTEAHTFWWSSFHQTYPKMTIIIGALTPYQNQWRKSAIVLQPYHPLQAIHARQTIPIIEWQPWNPNNIVPFYGDHRINSAELTLNDQKSLFIFCYEDLLTLPWLVSWLSQPPNLIIELHNVEWAHNLSEPEWQKELLTGWARLWDIPVISAGNTR